MTMDISAVERIFDREQRLLAVIVRDSFTYQGVAFLTPDELSQQFGYLHHPAGKQIQPHVHNPAPRNVQFTQEVLFIRRGKLRVDFYDSDRRYLESTLLYSGDTILLIQGGHGFECLEETIMLEVKQGPYVGEHDKTRFRSIASAEVRFRTSPSLQTEKNQPDKQRVR